MKNVVITGSSRGIGLGLAMEFLKRGHNVVISGSRQESTNKAMEELTDDYQGTATGITADVRKSEDIINLYNKAVEKFGAVDIWVNMAGLAQDFVFGWELDPIQIKAIIDVNIWGTINATHIIAKKMMEAGNGFIYNVEGFGSDGRKMAKMGVYGMSKTAITYFTKSFAKELKGKKNRDWIAASRHGADRSSDQLTPGR